MNILVLSHKGDCKPLLEMLAEGENTVRVWCQLGAPIELFSMDRVEVVTRWSNVTDHSEVALFDSPELSKVYKAVSRSIPVIGGAVNFHLYPSRQGDIYYRLGIPTIPRAQGERRITWGLFSDIWLHRGGDQRGDTLLNQLAPYLSYIGYKGPMGICWTRYRYSNFLIDSSMAMGYDSWVSGDRAVPMDMQIKEIVKGWH